MIGLCRCAVAFNRKSQQWICIFLSMYTIWVGRHLLQRGRITCNAERCNTYRNSVGVCPSVRLSVTRWYPIQMNEERIMQSSLWGREVGKCKFNFGWAPIGACGSQHCKITLCRSTNCTSLHITCALMFGREAVASVLSVRLPFPCVLRTFWGGKRSLL